MKNFIYKNILLCCGIGLYLLSIVILVLDKDFNLRWNVLFLWLFGLILICLNFISFIKLDFKRLVKDHKRELLYFLIIFNLAIFTRFLFLSIYPFITTGDELRDGGLDAIQILNGTIKNIFGYGRYDAHGLIIPTFNSLFYMVFGNSDLAFKVPSALLSILNISILYGFLWRFFNYKVAFWGAFVLTLLPLDLYFARTQTVVVFSILFTTLIFGGLAFLFTKKNEKYLWILGILLGFTFNLHASVKTVAMLAILLILIFYIYKSVKEKRFSHYLSKLFIFLLLIIIGFGPRLFFTTPDIFFHTSRVDFVNQNSSNKISDSLKNYPKSLMVYFYEPTSGSAYKETQPILPFYLGFLFIIGVVMSFLRKKWIENLLLIFALIIPLTKSAITNIINGDHRLAPLFIITAIFTGLGIEEIYKYLHFPNKVINKIITILFTIILIILISIPAFNFYNNEKASQSMNSQVNDINKDFMLATAVKFIKINPNLSESKDLCMIVSYSNVNYYNYLHNLESLKYYLPDKEITFKANVRISDTEMYLVKNCIEDVDSRDWVPHAYCLTHEKYLCPFDNTSFLIYS